MDLDGLIDIWGDRAVITVAGLLIGILFGVFAQRSRFCLRSATVEFWARQGTSRLAIWLFAFSAAMIATQALIASGWLDVSQARQLSARGSLSGALVGGLLFGTGMILARGCSSRMLILSANGNLRALLTGLIFAVTAQASLNGLLSPLRTWISGWWTIDGSSRDLLGLMHVGHAGGLLFGLLWLAAAIHFGRRAALQPREWLGAVGVGLVVACGWLITYQVGTASFDVMPVQSLSFTGPSADVLMLVLSPPGQPWDFDIGLVPGVVLGSFLSAAWRRELKLEGFKDGHSMRRYIVGAICMGFGGMLAGGCAVGAGVSGASIFALTAWIALIGMWAGAGLADALIDRPERRQAALPQP
ncbi:MAG: YeeE/YedE family protein [Azonexaceae bacterium]|uniref:YeeE/YedE family protein n=1 Tax=Azonexus sp. R2A61 TaxID=2744443 RepID=UPI001F28A0B1|nr:YeeE/YedE family protein [Azonexus sp. R2A61]MCE1238392.1 YeeE/YedE family protein [Azonexaceae bacterium]